MLGGVLVAVAAVILAVGECFYVNLRIGSTPVPLAQIVAIVANLALPWAAYRLTGHRGAAVIPALIWGIVAIVLAARGPGGDVVVPGNWQGIFLLLGGAAAAVISIVVLVQPPRRQQSTEEPPRQGGASRTSSTRQQPRSTRRP